VPGGTSGLPAYERGLDSKAERYVIYVGQDIRALEQQLAAANSHVAQLEAQLANVPVSAPAPVPADPKAAEALNAVMELAKALKLVAA